MSDQNPVVLLVCAETTVSEALVRALTTFGSHYRFPGATRASQARVALRRDKPAVIFFHESAVDSASGESAGAIIARLTEHAPVVAVVEPELQTELAFLIASGAVDFVVRRGDVVPIAAAFLERRIHLSARAGGPVSLPGPDLLADFGEVLRHELNNPLTGILGNAELLISELKRGNGEQISVSALHRLETVADLAVRLRETVRRLSEAWESRHAAVRSV